MPSPCPQPLEPGQLFDRTLLKRHRDRAASTFPAHDFLKERVAQDLAFRLKLIRRSFPLCVDLGAHTGQLGLALSDIIQNPMIACDLSHRMLTQAPSTLKVVLDEEALPFAKDSLDLVVSALSLHWVNDLPGLLVQVHHCLKPDGLFLAALLGGETLFELRDCLSAAEMELRDGVTPRLSPMISVKEAGGLLQRAGFALPVVDLDRVVVTYPHPLALLHDLRNMGETNVLYHRTKAPMTRTLLARAFELYQLRYGLPDGRISATFDIVTLTGWVPHASQPKALKRGSAKARIGDYI